MILSAGFHIGVKAEDYHRDVCAVPSLSSSIAQVLLRESPRKAWFQHSKLNPDYREAHEAKFDLGTAVHAALLENDHANIVVVEAADWRTKVAKEQRDAARAEGKVALLERHWADVMAMVGNASEFIAKSEIADHWRAADSEVTGVCEEQGVWLRCRFDKITKNRRTIMDYKSTEDAAPDVFSRLLVRMGYHIQDAFYRRVARNLGITAPRFVFLAQSCNEPYECSLHACDPSLQEIADAEVERAIGLWRKCVQTKEWPSHGGRIHYALPTSYMIQDHEQRVMEEAA